MKPGFDVSGRRLGPPSEVTDPVGWVQWSWAMRLRMRVRNWINAGQLPSVRVGSRRVRIKRSDLDRFLTAGAKPATDVMPRHSGPEKTWLSSLFGGDSRDAAAANLLLTGGFQAPAVASKVAHSCEASVRAPYGGRGVKWMAFMVLFLQRGVGDGDVVAVGGAVRASAGVATVVSLICGGWVPQDLGFVARPLSILERVRRAGGCSWARRGLVCAMPGSPGRLASRNGCRSGWSERGADPPGG